MSSGRKGLGWGAGGGLVVGLVAPPLLASVVGAAAGGVVDHFAPQTHHVRAARQDGLEALPKGSAGIIAVFPDGASAGHRVGAARLTRQVLVESDEEGVINGLKALLTQAMGKFQRTAPGCRSRIRTSAAPSAAPWMCQCRTGRST